MTFFQRAEELWEPKENGLLETLDEAQLPTDARLHWEAANAVLMAYSALEPAENVRGRRLGYTLALLKG